MPPLFRRTPSPSPRSSVFETLQGFLFVLIATSLCQILYSPLGFNPSDEGYMLSGSRRLLEGAIPHRDYISLRPVGTHIWHSLWLLVTTDHLMLLSRGVAWFQLAVSAWLWIRIVEYFWGSFPTTSSRLTAAVVAFCASAHTFPVMVWNSIDGFFFISCGLYTLLRTPRLRWAGVFFLGLTPLCRQNFLIFSPLILLLACRPKSPLSAIRLLFLFSLPSLLYALDVILHGGLRDALIQMTGHEFRWRFAIPFLFIPRNFALVCLAALPTAFLVFSLRRARHDSNTEHNIFQDDSTIKTSLQPKNLFFIHSKTTGFLTSYTPSLILGASAVLWGMILYAIFSISHSYMGRIHGWIAFGMVIGLFSGTASLPYRKRSSRLLLGLVLLTGWCISFSAGYFSAALASPALFVPVFHLLFNEKYLARRVHIAVTVGILLLTILSFHYGRTRNVYCDLDISRLRYDVGDVLPGGQGIRTNFYTYHHLKELKELVEEIRKHGDRYVVVPEAAQFWVTSNQPNPLSCDWCIDPELQRRENLDRVLTEIDALPPGTALLVQKLSSPRLAYGPRFWLPTRSKVADHIRRRYRLVKETFFWKEYRNP
ncbi:MAG: hypothetical protein D6679_01530 [Candidatus Hydrogenedentota bacterium]|nr:MAG: hypothetical protein D6679_01530 [Candidatus Hydrogenedentota bacterium]